jgi:hypothetical protein
MFKTLVVAPLAAFLLSACVVAPADHGRGVVLAPALPLIVELDVEPFYYQRGYHYYYSNNSWRYSNSRSGPWTDLPRSHYPRETRFKGRADGQRGDRHDGRRGDRDNDRRDRR